MDVATELPMIEYHGHSGSTARCVTAVERLLHYGTPLSRAMIITMQAAGTTSHALLLSDEFDDRIVIKPGFTSGYSGEGPRGWSQVLGLLDWHGVPLDEVAVDASFLHRINSSALTFGDLDRIDAARPIRPRRLWQYMLDRHSERDINPWRQHLPILPLSLIDGRLAEFARNFWDDPDAALFKAHRRLETIVRDRVAVIAADATSAVGAKLYGLAFNGEDAPLRWPCAPLSERQGRASLFIGTAMAYRNARAHGEGVGSPQEQLAEFLLVNHLFRLEGKARARPAVKTDLVHNQVDPQG